MTSLSKVKREKEVIEQELFGSKTHDKYGRSYAMLEQSRKYEEMAFNSLPAEKQALVLKATEIGWKYRQKAIEWENQPEEIKRQSPFHEEYYMHSDITKHSFLMGLWMTDEKNKLSCEAFSVLLKARKKFDPYYWGHGEVHK